MAVSPNGIYRKFVHHLGFIWKNIWISPVPLAKSFTGSLPNSLRTYPILSHSIRHILYFKLYLNSRSVLVGTRDYTWGMRPLYWEIFWWRLLPNVLHILCTSTYFVILFFFVFALSFLPPRFSGVHALMPVSRCVGNNLHCFVQALGTQVKHPCFAMHTGMYVFLYLPVYLLAYSFICIFEIVFSQVSFSLIPRSTGVHTHI